MLCLISFTKGAFNTKAIAILKRHPRDLQTGHNANRFYDLIQKKATT
ncbi:MAG: hypothetical protein AAGD09_06565 [Cyanobacteria bacterium P01_F01_bin.56]